MVCSIVIAEGKQLHSRSD